MLDRIIVGPTDHPIQIRDALTEKLRDRCIPEPKKGFFCQIFHFGHKQIDPALQAVAERILALPA